MSHVPAAVHALMVVQHGVVSTSQLRSAGLTQRQIEYLCARGDLVSMIRGAYRSPSTPGDESARCAAVCLAREQTIIAGPTAGRLWGFRHVGRDRRIHVIAPRGRRISNQPWCVDYRTDAIRVDDFIERGDGIRVTTRARTAFDLARHVSDEDVLLSVIEQAMSDGGLRDGDMRAVAADWVCGRPWARRFLDQLDRRLTGPAAESEPEVRVGQALAAAGVSGIVRQFGIELPDYGRARFDLAVPWSRWAMEVDVFPTHRETIGRQRDEARDRAAAAVGWRVFRMSAAAYEHRFDQTIADASADFAVACGRSA